MAALRLAGIGYWLWRHDTKRMQWSDESYRLFGQAPGSEAPTYDSYLALISDEDRVRVRAAWAGTRELGIDFDLTYEIVTAAGDRRFVHSCGEAKRDSSGAVIAILGIHQDGGASRNGADTGTSQILAAAAHDMRQPLHSLNLLLAALAGRAEGSEIAALVNSAQISAVGVSGTVEAILGISAMRAGGAPPPLAEFDIAELLDHSYEQFAGQAANKGLEFRLVRCALRVRSDRYLLQRVLDILISNAIRHTEKGRILLGCRRHKGMLRIGVLDSGPGLDKQMLARFSAPPMHDGTYSKENWRGYALGVSIAQTLCAALGHEMSVSAKHELGAAVWLKLALASAAERVGKPSGAALKPRPGDEAVIILVEDDPELYFATSQLLIDWGYRVFGGGSAREAIEDCTANAGGRRPDLLLSDFKLPNGETAVDVIAALDRHFSAKIPAIVVSGDPSAAQDIAAEGLGFEILQKPIRAAKLRAIVRYTLENAG